MTEAEKIDAVGRSGYNIQFIKNPSEAVQIVAVKSADLAIAHIDNPSEAVKLAAVSRYGIAIRHIPNPSEAVCMAAVMENGWAIQHIKNPSSAVVYEAIKTDPRAIFFVSGPISDAASLILLLYHPLYPKTPKEILDRAPEILDAHYHGLGGIYMIGLSIGMSGKEISKTIIEWKETHSIISEEISP